MESLKEMDRLKVQIKKKLGDVEKSRRIGALLCIFKLKSLKMKNGEDKQKKT